MELNGDISGLFKQGLPVLRRNHIWDGDNDELVIGCDGVELSTEPSFEAGYMEVSLEFGLRTSLEQSRLTQAFSVEPISRWVQSKRQHHCTRCWSQPSRR